MGIKSLDKKKFYPTNEMRLLESDAKYLACRFEKITQGIGVKEQAHSRFLSHHLRRKADEMCPN